MDLLRNYGESVWRVLFCMGVALFGFAAYYWGVGAVLANPVLGPQGTATSFWPCLIYSAGTFTTSGFPRLQAASGLVRLVTAIQAIVGISLAGRREWSTWSQAANMWLLTAT